MIMANDRKVISMAEKQALQSKTTKT